MVAHGWYIRWKTQGKSHRILIPAATENEAAVERAARKRSGVATGGPSGRTAVHTAVAKFLETRKTHATQVQDRSNLKRLTAVMGDRPIGSVTTPQLRVWMDGLRQQSGEPY